MSKLRWEHKKKFVNPTARHLEATHSQCVSTHRVNQVSKSSNNEILTINLAQYKTTYTIKRIVYPTAIVVSQYDILYSQYLQRKWHEWTAFLDTFKNYCYIVSQPYFSLWLIKSLRKSTTVKLDSSKPSLRQTLHLVLSTNDISA